MGIDMLGSGQLGAVSVCVYGGGVLLADSHSPPAQGWWTLLVGKAQHRTGNRMENNSQLGGAAQLSRVWNSYRTHDDIGMQSPMTHFITNQSIPIIKMYSQQSTV